MEPGRSEEKEKVAELESAAFLLDTLREIRVRSRIAGRALGLGRAQQGVLQVLIRNNGIDMKALAERLEVRQSSATVAVNPLVKKGLVKRKSDENDGRVTRIFLTAKAKGLARRLRTAQLKAAAEMLEPLSGAEKKMLAKLLKKILNKGF